MHQRPTVSAVAAQQHAAAQPQSTFSKLAGVLKQADLKMPKMSHGLDHTDQTTGDATSIYSADTLVTPLDTSTATLGMDFSALGTANASTMGGMDFSNMDFSNMDVSWNC
jgi:hypothetical protein